MKKDFNWSILDSVLQFNANKGQCAALLGTSEDTIERRIKKYFSMTFEQYKETKLGLTKIKLQQKAVQMALTGHPTMLIFCLKNLCNWVDRVDTSNTSEIIKTINLKYALNTKESPNEKE